jgi:hypothetical protein
LTPDQEAESVQDSEEAPKVDAEKENWLTNINLTIAGLSQQIKSAIEPSTKTSSAEKKAIGQDKPALLEDPEKEDYTGLKRTETEVEDNSRTI